MTDAESPLIEPIADDEPISRFLTKKGHYYMTDPPRVHHSAFSPKDNSLSAYRTKDLSEFEIWEIARRFVTEKMIIQREVLARAELRAGFLKDSMLRLYADGEPHPRHVNIEGWPVACEDMLAVKKKLANEARLVVK